MNELLEVAVKAHGGLDRWNQLKSLKSNLSITGTLWQVKRRPDVLKEIRMETELRRQQLTTYRAGEEKRFVWTPTSVAIETVNLLDIQNWLGHKSLETTQIYPATETKWMSRGSSNAVLFSLR